jgi:hypothetical protein
MAGVVVFWIAGPLSGGVLEHHSWASSPSDRAPSRPADIGLRIGVPLPDREIRLRATGIGVTPIQVLPGVIYGEDGPVKLWDEVSAGNSDSMNLSSLRHSGR